MNKFFQKAPAICASNQALSPWRIHDQHSVNSARALCLVDAENATEAPMDVAWAKVLVSFSQLAGFPF